MDKHDASDQLEALLTGVETALASARRPLCLCLASLKDACPRCPVAALWGGEDLGPGQAHTRSVKCITGEELRFSGLQLDTPDCLLTLCLLSSLLTRHLLRELETQVSWTEPQDRLRLTGYITDKPQIQGSKPRY